MAISSYQPVHLLQLCIIFVCFSVSMGRPKIYNYWVRPDTVQNCPESVPTQQCITLTDLVSPTGQSSPYYKSRNVTLHFLTGVHTPNASGWISSDKNAKTINVIGNTNCSAIECKTIIECGKEKIGFAFSTYHVIRFENIEIKNCGYNITTLPDKVLVYPYISEVFQTHASILVIMVKAFSARELTIQGSMGFGLLLLDAKEKSEVQISDSTFRDSNQNTYRFVPGGNMVIMFRYSYPNRPVEHYISIRNTSISNGYGSSVTGTGRTGVDNNPFKEGHIYHTSGGLTIWQFASSGIQANIYKCNFTFNTAEYGAGLYIPELSVPWNNRKYRAFNSINIRNCTFMCNRAVIYGGAINVGYVPSSNEKHVGKKLHVWLTITTVVFVDNIAEEKGGGLYLNITADNHRGMGQLSIKDKTCFISNRAKFGAAIYTESTYIIHPPPIDYSRPPYTLYSIKISGSTFESNSASRNGGGIYSSVTEKQFQISKIDYMDVTITECSFVNNSAQVGSACYIRAYQQPSIQHGISKIASTTLTRNTEHGAYGGSVIGLENVQYITLESINITDNLCRGVYSNMSGVNIQHQVKITDNRAQNGGGILLDYFPPMNSNAHSASRLIFTLNQRYPAVLYLLRNQAREFGGGLAVIEGCKVSSLCFFTLEADKNDIQRVPPVRMANNTADLGGHSLYGGNLESCNIEKRIGTDIQQDQLDPIDFWGTFYIEPTDRNLISAVSSEPYKVCICDENFSFNRTCRFEFQVEAFPGQVFKIPVVGVGQYNFSTPSVIRARLLHTHMAYATLLELMIVQSTGLECRNLSYSIDTTKQNTTIELQLSIENRALEYTASPNRKIAEVKVHIKECPHGFQLDMVAKRCNCTDYLTKAGITCSIDNQTLQRTPFMWIGNYLGEVVVQNNCPFDYCKQNILNIDPYNQQEQCDFNRNGVLCGACRPGLSLVLGTSNCKKCSNIYLLLLIPFALAGVALVILLLKCNLTVSTGTINGLIFYANIIQANKSIFFPPGLKTDSTYFFSIFIAWLNLDFGKEICFVENLTAITRTWLQFVFPIYIWLIVGAMILVSRYSITISRLTGINTVSVLATLFLLSYAKLVRAVLDSFAYTVISDGNGTNHKVWQINGNYNYLQWPHIMLFIFALLVLLAYVLPFTLIVLISPLLQAYSHTKLLCWVNKVKPLIDSYQGPYITKHRYWTGLLLLYRSVLFPISAVLDDPKAICLVIIITNTLLIALWLKITRVYRNKFLNALELFFTLNLLIFTASTLYIKSSHRTSTVLQDILVGIAVGTTFVCFICILLYHMYGKLSNTKWGKKLVKKIKDSFKHMKRKPEIDVDTVELEATVSKNSSVSLPTFSVVELAEPLLQEEETTQQ